MASYTELFDLRSNSALRNKVTVAVAVKAQELLSLTPPSPAQVAWANDAINAPDRKAEALLNYVLAANKSASVSQIQAADDLTVQSNVSDAVDALIDGGA